MRLLPARFAGLVLLTLIALAQIDATSAITVTNSGGQDNARAGDNVETMTELEDQDVDDDEEEMADAEHEEISTSLKLANVTLGKNGPENRDLVSSILKAANATTTAAAAASNATAAAKIGGDPATNADGEKPEELPEPLELRYLRPVKYRRRPYFSPTRRTAVNRRNVYHDKLRGSASSLRPTKKPAPPTASSSDPKRAPTENECTFFSKTVCLEAVDYPMEAILRSIRKNKEMVTALLADFKVQEGGFTDDDDLPLTAYKSSYDNRYNRYDPFESSNEIKRKYEFNSAYDNVEEGFTCPSQVKYARPQLARAASGIWKYIINTGEHTQTLRLEKCSRPRASCSFISENYRSSCMQVYNYHRLLTWDSKLGLHMDIFKVPTCCSCHVHGYTDIFPPHQTDPPLKAHESFPGADFATSDHHVRGSSHFNKYANSLDSAALNLFREQYGGGNSEQDEGQLQHSSSHHRRPSITKPPSRPRKPPPNGPRPFDKLPQQHAPNTRAPGYKGPRPHRPNRPFRRESAVPEVSDFAENSTNLTLNRFSQSLDNEPLEPSLRLQTGFDEEYQETQRRVNYNYHPIIDFFKPEAAMLKAEEPIVQASAASTIRNDQDSWKPIFKP